MADRTHRIVLTNDPDVHDKAGFDGLVEIDGQLMHCIRGARVDMKSRTEPVVTLWLDPPSLELHIKGNITLPDKEIELLREFFGALDEG